MTNIYRNIYNKYILPRAFLNQFIVRFLKYKRIKNSIRKKIKGTNNQFSFNNAVLLDIQMDIEGNNNLIKIETGSVLRGVKFFIRGNGHSIYIGKNCIFSRGSLIWFEDYNGRLEIGDNTTVEDVHFAITEPNSKILIGEDCMFAYDIDLRTGDSHSIIDVCSQERINFAEDIIIGNHVWLAAHCKVLKGVKIKNNCIVASSSLLTKSFETENVILAGSPAVIMKRNIDWKRERIYDK